MLTQQLGFNLCQFPFDDYPFDDFPYDDHIFDDSWFDEWFIDVERTYYKINEGLTSIPTDIPADALEVYLYHNCITRIEANVLSHLSVCKHLELNNNEITDIEPRAFNGLSALTWLDLSRNKITELKNG